MPAAVDAIAPAVIMVSADAQMDCPTTVFKKDTCNLFACLSFSLPFKVLWRRGCLFVLVNSSIMLNFLVVVTFAWIFKRIRTDFTWDRTNIAWWERGRETNLTLEHKFLPMFLKCFNTTCPGTKLGMVMHELGIECRDLKTTFNTYSI